MEINGRPAEGRYSFGGLYLLTRIEEEEQVPLPPSDFNPDPGISKSRDVPMPPDLFPALLPQLSEYGEEAVPRSLGLPRKDVREMQPRRTKLEYPEYHGSELGLGVTPGDEPVPNRWFVGFGRWQRYADPAAETPYQQGALKLWHPYYASLLKGDSPVFGEDIFLDLTVTDFAQFELRRLPTPSGVSTARPNSSEFFGRSTQAFFSNDLQFAVDLFKGETAFKPVEWAVRFLGVYNNNYLNVQERNALDPDPRGPDKRPLIRTRDFYALQEAFGELHIRDLSNNYDFISSRFGIQPFVSDFRGFIFNDSNLGIRIFGNQQNNLWQYNFVAFDMREKDTYSDLNQFQSREQQVYIANVYRQDFLAKGYTAQLSLHANFDEASRHYDKNNFLVRPAPIGEVRDHHVQSYYLGWTGDGHIGRVNVTHAFYQVFGKDSFNGIAGHEVAINAQMAALELSLDKDWLRHKLTVFYASGDDNPRNYHARGFDTILDRPFLLGGPFSYYVHQGFNLSGTAINFKQRDSLVPNFRSSKTEGQSNFVNPGAIIIGYGADADLAPKVKAFANVNYIWTATTEPTQRVLFTNHASNDIGLDASVGLQMRPLLTDNIIISAGIGFLVPGQGYKDIYRANTRPVPGYPQERVGPVDKYLYSAIVTVTLTY
ncbi:MAG: hypothetical protein M3Y69_02590 [Verrucomicrobiota bacterium]|nr:hypothetical protein [Verrucomicrobiota bacterium]